MVGHDAAESYWREECYDEVPSMRMAMRRVWGRMCHADHEGKAQASADWKPAGL